MANPVDVCWYDSAWSGAVQLSGQAGAAIGVLDCALLSGFGSKTLSSLTVSGGVATAVVSAGHQFTDHAVVLIGGAAVSALNGKKRIAVVDSTTFTFDATGVADQTVTGTITAKVAPQGSWEKVYSGTNTAVYRSTSIASNGRCLRIDDSAAQYPKLRMYESMSDVDTGVGPGPVSGPLYCAKSTTANATTRPWRVYADDLMVYFVSRVDSGSWYHGVGFGKINPIHSADAFCDVLIAGPAENYASAGLGYLASTINNVICRDYTQTGAAVAQRSVTHSLVGGFIGSGSATYPNPAGNLFLCAPIELWSSDNKILRGFMPGLFSPLHAYSEFTQGQIITDVIQYPGRRFAMQGFSSNSMGAFDITGPWR